MEKKLLETGEIVSTHGIRGEVKILPWADAPDFLLQFKTLYLNGRPYEVESSRVHKTCVLAKLRGIDTPEKAMLLRGQTVSVDREGLTLPAGTVFIADLIGCRVLDDNGTEIGKIKDVLTMPASDVYVIQGEKSYMIPAVKEFVREINVAEGFVKVHLIEGMATDEN
ncbi:MAG: 16S rRNA processing protein RimM [Oscillospiraceae bacterium]|nr:16S rRNA processing protein RimM [Oscillospiraceae bacterium]